MFATSPHLFRIRPSRSDRSDPLEIASRLRSATCCGPPSGTRRFGPKLSCWLALRRRCMWAVLSLKRPRHGTIGGEYADDRFRLLDTFVMNQPRALSLASESLWLPRFCRTTQVVPTRRPSRRVSALYVVRADLAVYYGRMCSGPSVWWSTRPSKACRAAWYLDFPARSAQLLVLASKKHLMWRD